ncbi:MAG: hypothetical protein ABI112_02205, partial [Terracoccus sp.]
MRLAATDGGVFDRDGRPDAVSPAGACDDVVVVAGVIVGGGVTVVVTVTVTGGRVWFSFTGESDEQPAAVMSATITTRTRDLLVTIEAEPASLTRR